MLIIMHPGANQEQVAKEIAVSEHQNLSSHLIQGVEQTIIGAVGDSHSVGKEVFEILPGVAGVTRISQPNKLASRQFHSNDSVFPMLYERGIRTFETATRNTTDINAIPVLKAPTHLPVILDPSHSTGLSEYVASVAKAGIPAGADGLIIEVHNDPAKALSDGRQSLTPEKIATLVKQVKMVAYAVERRLAPVIH